MARLYADEQFPHPVVKSLRVLGHDVLTVQEANKDNQRISDPEVLDFASQDDRAVLTLNRKDFIRLHRLNPVHGGIIVCTNDRQWESLTQRINLTIQKHAPLQGKLLRVVRPAK